MIYIMAPVFIAAVWLFLSYPVYHHGLKTDHFNGRTFYNPGSQDHSFLDVLKWLATRKPAPWPDKIEIEPRTEIPKKVNEGLEITFINHSSLLIQWHSLNILTDPFYSERASPFSHLGPKRVHEPGIPFDSLPPIDLVLISHNHYDHMDLKTLAALQDRFNPLFLTGLGNKKYLEAQGLSNIIELDWWETHSFPPLQIIFTPAKHFSARWLWDKNKTLWGGFLIKLKDDYLYFAGDTGYSSFFKEIYNRFGAPLVSFLPIGSYEPAWFMSPNHLSPQEALKATEDLHSRLMIPIHYGTLQMADDGFDEPLKDLLTTKKHLPIKPLSPGESLFIKPTRKFTTEPVRSLREP